MFYISSHGHAASGWISKALNQHDEIICWHGTRSIPPYISGYMDLNEKDFVNGLVECEIASSKTKVFGACHGFYGSRLFKDVKDNKGTFLALVRNPIKRIHSHFCAQIAYQVSIGEFPGNFVFDLENFFNTYKRDIDAEFPNVIQELNIKKKKRKNFLKFLEFLKKIHIHGILKKHFNNYKDIKKMFRDKNDLLRIYEKKNNLEENETKKNENDFLKYLQGSRNKLIAKRVCYCFIESCFKVFNPDQELLLIINHEDFIKMEEMTKSSDYFDKKILEKIINKKGTSKFFEKIYSLERLNLHSFKSLKDFEILNIWPSSFKEFFVENYSKSSARLLYNKMGYSIESKL